MGVGGGGDFPGSAIPDHRVLHLFIRAERDNLEQIEFFPIRKQHNKNTPAVNNVIVRSKRQTHYNLHPRDLLVLLFEMAVGWEEALVGVG